MGYHSGILKIEFNIKRGLKERASIQLRSLINDNPNDLELRNKLAQLYFDAGFYDAAGKFWIFNHSDAENIRKCVEIYHASVNQSANQILKDIKFRGDKLQLPPYAQNKLNQLEQDSFEKTGETPTYEKIVKEKANLTKKPGILESVKEDVFKVGCYATLILIGISIVVGLVTMYNYFFYSNFR